MHDPPRPLKHERPHEMVRQNKRIKNSNDVAKHRKSPPSNEDGGEGGGSVNRTLYVQLLLNDPALVHHAQHLKETWTDTTTWEVDNDIGQTSLVLLSMKIQSHIQLQVVKDILSSSDVGASAGSASCTLQMKDINAKRGKCLRLTLRLSEELQAFLAKTSNSIQLKLASHGIHASNRFDANAIKKLRPVVLWSLNETSPFQSLHDKIAETNRQRWSAPLDLRTLVLAETHTLESILSVWTLGSSQAKPALASTSLRSALQDQVPLEPKTVVIMRGQPGSGKSTLSRTIQAMARSLGHDVAVCSADTYFDTPLGYYHDKSQLTAAHDACKRAFSDAIEASAPVVIVDNTHSCLWEYEPYRTAALEAEYRVVVVEVGCDDVSTAIRTGLRNSHGVGIDVILRMHHRWEPHVSVHPNEVHVLFEPSFSLADNRRAVGLLLQGDVYIAAIYFSNETRQVLLERFPPKHAHVIAEHMTLAFRPSREFVESLPLGQHNDMMQRAIA
ncbi:hypothetical protein H310_06818 [Aphanomyces invadans]|uniref:Uncharacterized protein n=1 Tax=Aphanomyces invadans TaxID=157072 RepID=A0A024U5Q5_9STRA|nr:hypothetical protein H310_06818 [Aphanomyces invadans]ETW01232.1 hypothetical protein H310_06818 [Aphanomyces invadans]|eukprot:XP_008870230.1 hypothetical protein H310_06818 [Aphanomyces invadans]